MRYAALLLLVGLLAVPLLRPAPVLVVHPIAPPLTRIAALGDRPVDPSPPHGSWVRALEQTVLTIGTPEQKAALQAFAPDQLTLRRKAEGGIAVRRRQQARAAQIADLLGPERVSAIVANKEALTQAVGEGTVWATIAGE